MITSSQAGAILDRLGGQARLNEPLRRHTSYRIGGPADVLVIARTSRDLTASVQAAAEAGIPWHIIGAASNLLVADGGVDGVVVKVMTRGMHVVPGAVPGETFVKVEAGCVIGAVARKTAEAGLVGLEWAGTVPGTVGAAVVNNSGAFGSCIADCLINAELYFPGQGGRTIRASDLDYGYRTSKLKTGAWQAAVLAATLRTTTGDTAAVTTRLAELETRRRTTQPLGPSVGSIFRNPEGGFAGALIEQAGLKGMRVGGAEISAMHGNFILNRGTACARDVLDLARLAQQAVWGRTGVWLVPEIQMLGRWAADDLAGLEGPPNGGAAKVGQAAS
ncbi:MAG: UDP-N-acetylmuramate dehydrogenase [Chloroflexi bacterium]|nr:UDP-N-acetylmuramate dehydrogenase [Chloroflexota bacterium]